MLYLDYHLVTFLISDAAFQSMFLPTRTTSGGKAAGSIGDSKTKPHVQAYPPVAYAFGTACRQMFIGNYQAGNTFYILSSFGKLYNIPLLIKFKECKNLEECTAVLRNSHKI